MFNFQPAQRFRRPMDAAIFTAVCAVPFINTVIYLDSSDVDFMNAPNDSVDAWEAIMSGARTCPNKLYCGE